MLLKLAAFDSETIIMSEWLVGCYNTHQPPIFTAGNLRYWRRL